MGKLSDSSPRSYFTNGVYNLNGKTKARTRKKGNTVYSDYYMNPDEHAVYDYSQKTLAEIIPQINTFSPEVQNNIQAQMNAYQNQCMNSINSLYTPLLRNLKSDMASRFGNINNSMFLDKLSNIENCRSNAIAQLAENLLAKQNDLVNNELSNRYNLINLLNGLQNQYNSNAMSGINMALNSGNCVKNAQSQNSGQMNLNSLMALATMFI